MNVYRDQDGSLCYLEIYASVTQMVPSKNIGVLLQKNPGYDSDP